MSAVFLKLLNMSIAAGWLVVAVIVLRLCLRKAPKAIHCALWALVAIRLICPFSLESSLSLIPEEVANGSVVSEWADDYIDDIDIHHPSSVYYDAAIGAGREPISDGEGGYYVVTKHDQLGEPATIENTVVPVLSWVWLAGVAALLLYAAISYLRIRFRVKVSLNWKDNIWRSEQVDSPFILGVFRPKIYLPFGMDESQMNHVVAHEQAHLSRRDHWWKPLGFILLAVYWFNPLMWVAYILLCRDIELACDEKVIRDMGVQDKKAYSEALLACSVPRRMIAACPLAFGEVGVKKRIASVLHYKKPAFWILIVALIASIAVAVCFLTNPTEEEASNEFITWEVDAEYPEAVVDIVDDYIMQQVEYYNDLGSGENAIGGEYSILEAKVVGLERRCRLMETETHLIELYRLEYRLLPSEPDHVVLAGGMQMEDGWITEYSSTGQPYFAILCDSTSGEETWMLMGMTNSDTINIEYNTDAMRAKHGDRYIAAAMEIYKAYLRAEAQVSYDTAEDISYYLELAAGEPFQDMNLERQVSLLVEYEDLLDDYSLIARETEDGKTAYIVGQYNGNPLESPLHGMYSIDMYTGEEEYFRFLYREDEVETVEAVVAANKTEFPPSAGYRIEDSVISWTENSGVILIQPKENTLLLDVPWNRYFYTPNGREYITDAVSRGIDVCGRTDTFLYVYRISERFGEISERIALTEAEAQAILAEERVSITDGFGFSASLHIDGQTTYYNEREGIPQTVLDLAVEKCDYRFGDPSYITDTIREARLDCDWLDTTLYADEADLPRLREILKNAEHGYVGSCGYGAKLTLTFTGGEKLTVFKGCDGCDTIVFGSYGGYFLGEKENIEFWEMFGLDPDTKERVEANPNGRELLYKDEEILISVPAQYAHLVKMDGLYSDDQYTNKANFYYKPEYFEHEAYTAPLNGGWMLTVSTTLPSFAEATWAGHIGTCWTKDGSRVYVEQRPVDDFNCSDANLAEFKAVMDSIQVEYIGLKSFETGYLLPTQQLSATEQAAAVNAIFTNLKTGWWNGNPLKNCAYESAAFECLHREVNGNIVNLYGYGGYFRWDQNNTCVEYWDAPTIVTLDTDTQQVLDLWWPGDGAAYESSILDKFPAEIGSTVATPNSDRSTTVRNNLMEASKESMVSASQQSESGQTRRFGVQDLRVEVTNVLSTHKTALLAEGIALHEYVVVSCTPESKITVLDAGMSDPTYAEDGKPHPQWGLLYTGETERTRITDETGMVPVTSDLEGIYNLEASLFVIQLNLVD